MTCTGSGIAAWVLILALSLSSGVILAKYLTSLGFHFPAFKGDNSSTYFICCL